MFNKKRFSYLNDTQKSIILIKFLELLDEQNKTTGKIYGSYQIIEMIEEIAMQEHFIKCSLCGRE